MSGFAAAKAVGEATEERIVERWLSEGIRVADVRDIQDERRRDVDFRLTDPDTGTTVTVDVKSDSHEPVNFFLEDMYSDGALGRFWRSRAEQWFYVFTASGTVYVLDLGRLQRYVAERYDGLRRVQTRAYREGRDYLSVEGLLLPVRPTVRRLQIPSFTL